MSVQSRQSVKPGFPRPKGGAFSTAFANTREMDRPCFGGHERRLVRCARREARRVGWSVFFPLMGTVCVRVWRRLAGSRKTKRLLVSAARLPSGYLLGVSGAH